MKYQQKRTDPTLIKATSLLSGLFLFFAGSAAGGGAWAAAPIVVTSVTGSFNSGDAPLTQADQIAAGSWISTTGDSTASIMMSDSAVVRLCNKASMRMENETDLGPSTINLERGEIKASAQSRPSDNPLEIHTPAAIATLLGTAVHVSVNPVSGETVVTALEHRIHIQSRNDSSGQGIDLMPGQQVVIGVDQGPGMVRDIDAFQFGGSSDCLDDSLFRKAALLDARKDYGEDSIGDIAEMDLVDELPADVAAGPSLIPAGMLTAKIDLPICLSSIQCTGAANGPLSGTTGDRVKSPPNPF